jgi:hypothetical protein
MKLEFVGGTKPIKIPTQPLDQAIDDLADQDCWPTHSKMTVKHLLSQTTSLQALALSEQWNNLDMDIKSKVSAILPNFQ